MVGGVLDWKGRTPRRGRDWIADGPGGEGGRGELVGRGGGGRGT